MASEVKWIKITTDIFDDEKILLIESLPESYAIITVWFKLLCLAGKQNNSGVFMMGRIAYTDKMLATIFRMKESTVTLALTTFEQFGMVEIVDGVITIPNWGKHQNLEQLEERRRYQREYQKEYRKKQKLLTAPSDSESEVPEDDESKCSRKHLHKPNVNTLDRDKDKDEDKEDIYKASFESIISYLNDRAGTSFRPTSKATQKHIKARLSEGYKVEDFQTVIDKKCAEWLGDSKMEKYLRPETLFGTKFEGYLNAKTTGRMNADGKATGDSSKVRVGNYI